MIQTKTLKEALKDPGVIEVVEELLPIEGKPISIFADENAEYKNFFYLGTSAYDMKDYAILITKIVDGIEGFKGIMGRLLFVRGSITANVVSGMSDIGVYKAYNGVIMFKNNYCCPLKVSKR